MTYAIGHLSGCHLNPGVYRASRWQAVPRLRLARVRRGAGGGSHCGGRCSVRDCKRQGWRWFKPRPRLQRIRHPFPRRVFARLLPESGSCADFMFLMIILGATDRRAPQGFAPIAIGLGLTLIHLIGIPVTNLSVKHARSTGPAVFVGCWAMEQVWLFRTAQLRELRWQGWLPLHSPVNQLHPQARRSLLRTEIVQVKNSAVTPLEGHS